jgi:hypothetical protein
MMILTSDCFNDDVYGVFLCFFIINSWIKILIFLLISEIYYVHKWVTIYTVTIQSNQTQTCPTHHVHCFFPRQIAAAEVLSAQTWQKSRVSLPQVEKKNTWRETKFGTYRIKFTHIHTYITLHYITLNYITYIQLYICDYIYIMNQDQNYL